MAKRQPKHNLPPNFVDLRADALNRNNNLIDDIIRPFVSHKRFIHQRLLVLAGVLLVVGSGSIFITYHKSMKSAPMNPVPPSVKKAVDFPVYYPDNTKLPAGYSLDSSSFSAGGGAVLYNVQIPQKQQITVTEQKVPNQQALDVFNSQRLPLHTDVKTAIGTARVSALNNRSFTSLPTSKTWLLISAPYTIDSPNLNQFLQSLTY